MAIVIACYLIAMVFYRAFVPAHEYAMRTEQVLTMLFDAGMLAGIIAMKPRFAGLQPLFWIAVLAGVSLFAFRLTSNAAWWTGHLMYSLR
jgi:hypothetical protein